MVAAAAAAVVALAAVLAAALEVAFAVTAAVAAAANVMMMEGWKRWQSGSFLCFDFFCKFTSLG